MTSKASTSDRPVLRDSTIDDELLAEGYVVLRGAARPIVRELRRVHRQFVGRAPAGFHSTMWSSDTDHKRTVHGRLVEALTPLLDEVFLDYRPMLANFVTKARGDGGVMPAHRDWTFVDEAAGASSVNVWIPLTDVDGRNGGISVLPRSHRLAATIRGTDTSDPFSPVGDVVRSNMVELPMSAGDVLIHDHRVLHGSPPNQRRRARLATACAVVAADAQLVHYKIGDDGVMRRYRITDSFFLRHTFGSASLPEDVVLVGDVEFTDPVIDEADLAALTGAVTTDAGRG